MKLVVAAVGQRMPKWIQAGWTEYQRRFPPHLPVQLVEVPVAGRAGSDRVAEMEAERLLARSPARACRVALQGSVQAWSTEKLAERLSKWLQRGDPVWFFIGGAEGLAGSLLDDCHEKWSLGPAVYPHMLVRVLVAEQLYRAHSVLSGHPYHRA
jgi:23S rRNA (pseudouridine1915-N3)-methyltransferase